MLDQHGKPPTPSHSNGRSAYLKALKLTGRRELPHADIDALQKLAPEDWKPGDSEVEEFLRGLRGGKSV